MLNWNDIHHNRQRHAAFLRDSEQWRLAALVLPARSYRQRVRSFVIRLGVWLGTQMVVRGYRLLTLARGWDYPAKPMYNGANSTVQQL